MVIYYSSHRNLIQNSGSRWWSGKPGVLQSMGSPRVGHNWATELNWTLRSHGLQHTRLSCPSPTPRACSNSCPSSQWCHPTISSSVVPSSCLQSFPASRSLQWVSSLHQVAKVLEFRFSISPSNEYSGLVFFRIDWLDLLAVQGTLESLLQHHSSKSSILRPSAFFVVQLSHPYMTTGKTIALTRWTFVGKVMSLLFNKLSRLIITFLPRSKRLLIVWLHSPSAVILEPKKQPVTVSIVSPSICHEMMGPDAMILGFWILSFKRAFSLLSFTFIKWLFSSSSPSAIKVVLSVYLRLMTFLPAILIPSCALSRLAFHMIYSAYKLNKQGDNIWPWRTSFPIWKKSVVPCPVLTVAS